MVASRPVKVAVAVAVSTLMGMGLTMGAGDVWAQGRTAAPDTLAVGDYQLAPTLEIRTRGEYRRNPLDVGGAGTPPVGDQGVVMNRARLGLGARSDTLGAQVTLQDARAFGQPSPGAAFSSPGSLGSTFAVTQAYEAYLEVHTASPTRPSFVRVGRQAVTWGGGLLLGAADWSPVGRTLDAVRVRGVLGAVEGEVLAAMLDSSRPLGASFGDAAGPPRPGAQLVGLRAAWAFTPLLQVEGVGLARFARRGTAAVPGPLPVPGLDAPPGGSLAAAVAGETVTTSLRVSGAGGEGAPLLRGFSYALEGAFQFGRATNLGAGPAGSVGRRAFAGAAFASQTFEGIVGSPTVRLGGAYASGHDGGGVYGQFDPLLPDVHTSLGALDLFALSNLVEAHGRVTVVPAAPLRASVEYRYARLARAAGEWLNGYLATVGSGVATLPVGPAGSAGAELGHEVDGVVTYQPWPALLLTGGYSLLVVGDGARALVTARGGEGGPLAHLGYAQATLRVP